MGKTVKNAMTFERTGNNKPRRQVVEQGYFKDLSTSNIIFGALRELFRRYDTEVWAFCTFSLLALEVYQHIN